jgi:hypothetical protein
MARQRDRKNVMKDAKYLTKWLTINGKLIRSIFQGTTGLFYISDNFFIIYLKAENNKKFMIDNPQFF